MPANEDFQLIKGWTDNTDECLESRHIFSIVLNMLNLMGEYFVNDLVLLDKLIELFIYSNRFTENLYVSVSGAGMR